MKVFDQAHLMLMDNRKTLRRDLCSRDQQFRPPESKGPQRERSRTSLPWEPEEEVVVPPWVPAAEEEPPPWAPGGAGPPPPWEEEVPPWGAGQPVQRRLRRGLRGILRLYRVVNVSESNA